MRWQELERIVRKRPFEPFEIRLVDGRAFKFKSPEEFIISRSTLYTLDENHDGLHISIEMIATLHLRNGKNKRGG